MAPKKSPEHARMAFPQFVDKIFWALMTASAMYVATQVKDLNSSVNELNKNVAVMLIQMSANEKRDDAQDRQIDKLIENLGQVRR